MLTAASCTCSQLRFRITCAQFLMRSPHVQCSVCEKLQCFAFELRDKYRTLEHLRAYQLHSVCRIILKHSDGFCALHSRGDAQLSPSIMLKYKLFSILREFVSLDFVLRLWA